MKLRLEDHFRIIEHLELLAEYLFIALRVVGLLAGIAFLVLLIVNMVRLCFAA